MSRSDWYTYSVLANPGSMRIRQVPDVFSGAGPAYGMEQLFINGVFLMALSWLGVSWAGVVMMYALVTQIGGVMFVHARRRARHRTRYLYITPTAIHCRDKGDTWTLPVSSFHQILWTQTTRLVPGFPQGEQEQPWHHLGLVSSGDATPLPLFDGADADQARSLMERLGQITGLPVFRHSPTEPEG